MTIEPLVLFPQLLGVVPMVCFSLALDWLRPCYVLTLAPRITLAPLGRTFLHVITPFGSALPCCLSNLAPLSRSILYFLLVLAAVNICWVVLAGIIVDLLLVITGGLVSPPFPLSVTVLVVPLPLFRALTTAGPSTCGVGRFRLAFARALLTTRPFIRGVATCPFIRDCRAIGGLNIS